MSSDSRDTPTTGGTSAEQEPTSTPVDTSKEPKSPYDIGLVAEEEETGPKPLDTDLEDEQVKGNA